MVYDELDCLISQNLDEDFEDGALKEEKDYDEEDEEEGDIDDEGFAKKDDDEEWDVE